MKPSAGADSHAGPAPCAHTGLDAQEVWRAVLSAAEDRASVATLISPLRLVSLTPQRAVIGHGPRDALNAEMALGHLAVLFQRVLGSRPSLTLMLLTPEQLGESGKRGHTVASEPDGSARLPVKRDQGADAAEPRAGSSEPADRPMPRRLTEPASSQAAAPAVHAAPLDVEALKAHPLVKRAAELMNAKVVRITARPVIADAAAARPAAEAASHPLPVREPSPPAEASDPVDEPENL